MKWKISFNDMKHATQAVIFILSPFYLYRFQSCFIKFYVHAVVMTIRSHVTCITIQTFFDIAHVDCLY